VEGYEVAVRYIPLFGVLGVGGDFYDLFTTEEGKLGIVIGDVSGKGTRAAVIASDARSIIRAFAYKTSSAGTVLSSANSVLCGGQTSAESFVTVFLAILDPATGELCCASAGHPPPAIRRGDGSVEMLDFGQPPLGLMEKKGFAESRCILNFGDKIVLYTDGVSEARGSEMLGIEGVGRCLEERGGLDVEAVVDRLISVARDCAQGRLRDDVAVVALHRLGMVECRDRNASAS
jgi:sigma-B regulation protein RsbU (phosphoserine phosphatase)